MPVTGIPLPFISYGGASLVSLAAGLGTLQSTNLRRETPGVVARGASAAVRVIRPTAGYATRSGARASRRADDEALSGPLDRARPDRRSFHAPAPVPAPAIERILGRVRKPGRYAGGEWNSVQKDWAAVALKWCLAYPDLYEIGMSNLGLRILYEVLNDTPDRLAERCFAPDVDLQAQLRAGRLAALESRDAPAARASSTSWA